MKYLINILAIGLISLSSLSCSANIGASHADQNPPKEEQAMKTGTAQTELNISDNSFRGITVGDNISSYAKSDYVQLETLKTGEGDFTVYAIKDFNNNPAGYFMSDPNDESRVGDIIVQTRMAQTAEGIHVDSTLGDLRMRFPDIEVHGSEIEGRTYAHHNTLSYRLEVVSFSYEVDAAKIPADTKVTEIIINRQ